MNCKICSGNVDFFAREMILGTHLVVYYRCNGCGFIQTEEPYWLQEAYSSAITGSDTGLVSRNLKLAARARAVIALWFEPSGRFLDFAGGYGLLVRLMRDAGYDFYWYDQYCQNLFAGGFEANLSVSGTFEMVTAFEVVEHLHDPLNEIGAIARHSRNILFSTEIIPNDLPRPSSWWYYGVDHGQHISFYSLQSLQILADKLSLNFYSDGHCLHLFTEKSLSSLYFRLFTNYHAARLVNAMNRRGSLLLEDARRSGCTL